MRKRLQKFTDFAHTLLPHEVSYLKSVEQFESSDRKAILSQVYKNVTSSSPVPFDTSIDKRKYNHVMTWIQARLDDVDVDVKLRWYLHLEKLILTDAVDADDEKAFLKYLKNYKTPGFFFSKLYHVARHYADFLLIRFRFKDHKAVSRFIKKFKDTYLKSAEAKEELHQALEHIIGQHQEGIDDPVKWVKKLSDIFYDEHIEGHLRYMALVHLTFLCYVERDYTPLGDKLDYLDQALKTGKYYSKRHLINFYNHQMMYHSFLKEYDKAITYGKLAIRYVNKDYLLYLINLCSILIRTNRYTAALSTLEQSFHIAKNSNNFYQRIGYVGFYMKAMSLNGKERNAANYGEIFLKAYSSEILKFRWYIFFIFYLEALVKVNNYERILKIDHKYQLRKRDAEISSRPHYKPYLPLTILIAEYETGVIDRKVYNEKLKSYFGTEAVNSSMSYDRIIKKFEQWIPESRQGTDEIASTRPLLII